MEVGGGGAGVVEAEGARESKEGKEKKSSGIGGKWRRSGAFRLQQKSK